jgi:DNA processing protein
MAAGSESSLPGWGAASGWGFGRGAEFVRRDFVCYALGVEPRHAYIALNLIEQLGPVRLRQLLSHFGTAEAVLRASETELQRVQGIGPEVAAGIAAWEGTVDLEGELRRIREYGCQVWCQEDDEYPPLLREIYDPPIVLYVKGELRKGDRNSIAVVGSRQTTAYGQEVARRFAYQLAYTGVTVVSGGARGIDTAAHQGAISAGGRTLAVLGTGINLVFPPENRELFGRIAENGAVITQFPFNRPADKQSFPIRNRIVAGMTMGTVVVEANLTSGAMITANFAVDYGRQVFAVPGRIDSPRSRGCHELIRKGAKLCEGLEDILPEFEYLFPPANRVDATGPGRSPGLALSESEQSVMEAMSGGEWEVDGLVQATSMPASAVSVALFSLEMKRLVRQLPGRRFVRVGG